MSRNKVELEGTLCKPGLKEYVTQGGKPIVKFKLATYRKKDDKFVPSFHRVCAVGNAVSPLDGALPGDIIACEGMIEYGEYTNDHGVKINTTDIVVFSASIIKKKEVKPEPQQVSGEFDGDIPF
jgi:single-stranded DNA-binding protein